MYREMRSCPLLLEDALEARLQLLPIMLLAGYAFVTVLLVPAPLTFSLLLALFLVDYKHACWP